jgi:ligand-binding sensor domain-containing protein/signal transduction histidine kinase
MLFQFFIVNSSLALDPQKKISQYGYSVWSRQNGLPANSIRVATQTRDGYIWLGTTAGLLRFDGVRFEVINTDTADINNQEVISALCETRDSTLWIGTAYDGLRRLKNGKILSCDRNGGFPKKPIRALFESREGHLWIGSSDGLFEYIDGHCVAIPIDPLYISTITEDASGRIFVGTGSGVRFFEESRPDKIFSISKKGVLPQEDITSIFADRKGNVWIGTQNRFARWRSGEIIPERILTKGGIIHITSILEDRDGILWVGSTQGVFRLARGEWTNFTTSQGLLCDHILCIMEDQEGSIWLCTKEGLCRFRDVNLTTYTTQEGLVDDYITSVIEGADGSMYLLSAAKGGSIVKLKDGKPTRFPDSPPVGPSFLARDGSIWTSNSGFLSQIKNGHVIRYDNTTGLPKTWISAITEDSISLIIFLDRIGVRRFINGKLKPFLLADGQEYSSTEYVSCFYKDRRGILWIGTTAGLIKIQNGLSTTLRTTDGLADNWNRAFFEDRYGHLWIGSPRGGLTHYRDGKFISYNSQNGLFANVIYCVLVDDNDDVWVSTARGIGCISHEDIEEYEAGKTNVVHPQVFTAVDGMRTEECFGSWQPAGWKTRNGQLWFATIKGAVTFNPRKFTRNEVPPKVNIEQCISDLQAVPLDRFESLQPGREKFEFHYTALSYLAPDRVFFKYILEGYEREWVEAGTRRVAYYTNLPSGKYTFRVVACNNDGVWNETGASFAFELLPHFYETSWFYGLLVIVCGGMAYGLHRLRIWQFRQREKVLEQRVQDRTHQLEVANKELEAFSYSVSHDLRAPLRSINGFSSALLEDYSGTLDEQGKDYLRRVCAASQNMEQLIDDILNLSRVMRIDMKRTSVNLSNLAQSIALEFISSQPDRKVTFNISPDMVVHADRDLMGIVLENLLDNAWKFTSKHPTSTIEFGHMVRDGQKIFFVRDDGDGFDMAFAGKLFTAFQRMHTSAEFEGTGIGLTTVQRIINRHGGQVWAEAEKGKGATFYFIIPQS